MALDLRQNLISAQYLEKKIDKISPLIYLLILTTSILVLFAVCFHLFVTALWILSNVIVSFPLKF